jgi:hypothetical protein
MGGAVEFPQPTNLEPPTGPEAESGTGWTPEQPAEEPPLGAPVPPPAPETPPPPPYYPPPPPPGGPIPPAASNRRNNVWIIIVIVILVVICLCCLCAVIASIVYNYPVRQGTTFFSQSIFSTYAWILAGRI